MAGILAATEALNFIIFEDSQLKENIIFYDIHTISFRKCKVKGKREGCIACLKQIDFSTYDYKKFVGINTCSNNITNNNIIEEEWTDNIYKNGTFVVKDNELLIDVREKNLSITNSVTNAQHCIY